MKEGREERRGEGGKRKENGGRMEERKKGKDWW